MSEKIIALIPNRNILTTLKGTIDFLLKDPRVEVVIFDQLSTYEPLREYYKTLPERVEVVYSNTNGGPNSVWDLYLSYCKTNYFIVADPDCDYTGVPDDWLDKMLHVLEHSGVSKVGFSLEIDDLPKNEYTDTVKHWESKFWIDKNEYGWVSEIDSTFALYRPNSEFTYKAIRLDKPYCIKHVMWYFWENTLSPEWKFYLENISDLSYWGNRLKKLL